MPLYITALNSGSNGNCYYIANETEAVLIDAGISCREVEKRMHRLQLSMSKVKAIFVSHEHCDHIKGIPALADKYNIPVYITASTLKNCSFFLQPHHVKFFRAYEMVTIGELYITSFPKLHDAVEPHSFVINGNHIKIGVFTDIGTPCKNVVHHFAQCHAVFLEANYDEELLASGSYPHSLKNRIRGGKGHLSNRQAFELFTVHRSSHLSHLILSHLSKQNNSPERVQQLFMPHAGDAAIIVASRYNETPVYTINGAKEVMENSIAARLNQRPVQISLF